MSIPTTGFFVPPGAGAWKRPLARAFLVWTVAVLIATLVAQLPLWSADRSEVVKGRTDAAAALAFFVAVADFLVRWLPHGGRAMRASRVLERA